MTTTRAAAATLLVAGTAVALALVLVPSRAQVPTEAGILAAQCQSFVRFKTWLAFRAGPLETSFRYALHAHEDGRIGLDRVSGVRERIYWDGSELTRATDDNPDPRVIAGYDDMIADIWSECRAGFANSTWTVVPPPQGVPKATKYWVRLDLPFAWAQGSEFLVSYAPGSAELRQIVVRTPNNEAESFEIYGANWNASFPPQALGPQVPPFFPATYPGWDLTQQAIADEIEAGAKAKDLLIPIDRTQ